ncbi:hypothetical protein [Gracilimonas sp.]|uniref:hypothetical protein n=1 Tax=Gracilimonas sp. TaxID=1974203 RepID=UPI0032F0741E
MISTADIIKSAFYLILIVVIGFLLPRTELSAADNDSTKFYRKIVFRESPYAELKGAYKISQQEAEHCLHFKITYNKKGRPTMVEYKRGDELFPVNLPNRVLFNYFIRAPKTVIKYEKSKEIRTFFDQWDKPTAVSGQVFKEVYYFNDSKRSSLKFFSINNTPIENDWGIHRYEWSIDERGFVKEQRFDLDSNQVRIRPEFEFYEVRMEYDEKGLIKRLFNYGLDGKLTENSTGVAYDQLSYNDKGDFTGWEVFNKNYKAVIGNHPMVHRGEHSYNSKGYPVLYKSFDVDGNLINDSDNSYVNRRIYNDWGDLIQSRYYELNTNKLVKEGRPAIIDFVLTEEGYPFEITLLTGDGSFINNQPPKRRQTYYEDGKLKQISFWDKNYNLLDRYEHFYNERGQLSIIKRINVANEILYVQRRFYDEWERPIGFKYFTTEGKPTIGRGFHEMRYFYDTDWRRQEIRYDLEGNVIEN